MPPYSDDRDILFHLKRRLRERLEGDRDHLLKIDEEECTVDVLRPHVDLIVPSDYGRLGLILAETPDLGFPEHVYMYEENIFEIIQRSIGTELMNEAEAWLEKAQAEAEVERESLPEPTPDS